MNTQLCGIENSCEADKDARDFMFNNNDDEQHNQLQEGIVHIPDSTNPDSATQVHFPLNENFCDPFENISNDENNEDTTRVNAFWSDDEDCFGEENMLQLHCRLGLDKYSEELALHRETQLHLLYNNDERQRQPAPVTPTLKSIKQIKTLRNLDTKKIDNPAASKIKKSVGRPRKNPLKSYKYVSPTKEMVDPVNFPMYPPIRITTAACHHHQSAFASSLLCTKSSNGTPDYSILATTTTTITPKTKTNRHDGGGGPSSSESAVSTLVRSSKKVSSQRRSTEQSMDDFDAWDNNMDTNYASIASSSSSPPPPAASNLHTNDKNQRKGGRTSSRLQAKFNAEIIKEHEIVTYRSVAACSTSTAPALEEPVSTRSCTQDAANYKLLNVHRVAVIHNLKNPSSLRKHIHKVTWETRLTDADATRSAWFQFENGDEAIPDRVQKFSDGIIIPEIFYDHSLSESLMSDLPRLRRRKVPIPIYGGTLKNTNEIDTYEVAQIYEHAIDPISFEFIFRIRWVGFHRIKTWFEPLSSLFGSGTLLKKYFKHSGLSEEIVGCELKGAAAHTCDCLLQDCYKWFPISILKDAVTSNPSILKEEFNIEDSRRFFTTKLLEDQSSWFCDQQMFHGCRKIAQLFQKTNRTLTMDPQSIIGDDPASWLHVNKMLCFDSQKSKVSIVAYRNSFHRFFIPLLVRGNHWGIGVISLTHKTAFIFNSIHKHGYDKALTTKLESILDILSIGDKTWRNQFNVEIFSGIPEQVGYNDCGPNALTAVKRWCEGVRDFSRWCWDTHTTRGTVLLLFKRELQQSQIKSGPSNSLPCPLNSYNGPIITMPNTGKAHKHNKKRDQRRKLRLATTSC